VAPELASCGFVARADARRATARTHAEADRLLEAALAPTDFPNGARFGSTSPVFAFRPPGGLKLLSSSKRALALVSSAARVRMRRAHARRPRYRVCTSWRGAKGGGRGWQARSTRRSPRTQQGRTSSRCTLARLVADKPPGHCCRSQAPLGRLPRAPRPCMHRTRGVGRAGRSLVDAFMSCAGT
jgi:hypothetical protein